MEKMLIGRLAEADQESVDEYMEKLLEIDPYAFEPDRDPDLRVHSATPMNAESPYEKLLDSYLTPNEVCSSTSYSFKYMYNYLNLFFPLLSYFIFVITIQYLYFLKNSSRLIA